MADLTPEEIKAAGERALKHNPLQRDATALDMFVNVLTGGKLDETISSRAQRAADRGNPVGKAITSFLHLFQRKHGVLAEAGDLARGQDVESTEKNALDLDDTQ